MPNGELLMVPTKTSAGTERVGKPVADEDADEPEESNIMPNTGPLAVNRAPAGSRPDSKQAQMIAMLRRPEGATLEQIAEATGVEWGGSALSPCGDRFLHPPLRTGRASFPASGSPCLASG